MVWLTQEQSWTLHRSMETIKLRCHYVRATDSPLKVRLLIKYFYDLYEASTLSSVVKLICIRPDNLSSRGNKCMCTVAMTFRGINSLSRCQPPAPDHTGRGGHPGVYDGRRSAAQPQGPLPGPTASPVSSGHHPHLPQCLL